jgi:hypothetical protein
VADDVADILAGDEEPPQEAVEEQQPPEGEEAAAKPAEEGEEAAPEPEPKQPEMVPVGAVIEERRKGQAVSQQLNESNARFEKLTQRLDVLHEKANPSPDPETEPLEHLQHSNAQLAGEVAEVKQILQRAAGQQQQNNYQQQVSAMEAQFAQDNSDYYDAYAHLTETRTAELNAMGKFGSDADTQLQREAQWIVQEAVQAGKNPAEAVYGMAKVRGFVSKPNGGGGGGLTPAKTLKETAQNLENSNTLASAPGKVLKSDMTTEDLLGMTDDEFDKATSDENWDAFWKGK